MNGRCKRILTMDAFMRAEKSMEKARWPREKRREEWERLGGGEKGEGGRRRRKGARQDGGGRREENCARRDVAIG